MSFCGQQTLGGHSGHLRTYWTTLALTMAQAGIANAGTVQVRHHGQNWDPGTKRVGQEQET